MYVVIVFNLPVVWLTKFYIHMYTQHFQLWLRQKMLFSSIIIFFNLCLFSSSYQKLPPRNTCKEGTICMEGDPFELLQNLNKRKDEMVKKVLFEALKDNFSKIELPEGVKGKVNNEQFLKEAIETVMKKQKQETEALKNKNKKRERKEDKDIKDTQPSTIHTTVTSNTSYSYKPKNSRVDIHDWHDFYHYFPQLSTRLRLWKLEFKESARQNWKKFRGCANPGRLIDWLVPDYEEVKKAKRKKMKNRRERQRDF